MSLSHLIIGINNYPGDAELKFAKQDAQDVDALLNAIGSTGSLLLDATRDDITGAIDVFIQALSSTGNQGIFAFFGHSVQQLGENYLLPAGASSFPEDADDLANVSIPLDSVVGMMGGAGNPFNLVILSAAAENGVSLVSQWATPPAKGLAKVTPALSMLVAQASAPNTYYKETSNDSRNSLYVSSLLRFLVTPGRTLASLCGGISGEVFRASNMSQIPRHEHVLGDTQLIVPAGSEPIDVSQILAAADAARSRVEEDRAEAAAAFGSPAKSSTPVSNGGDASPAPAPASPAGASSPAPASPAAALHALSLDDHPPVGRRDSASRPGKIQIPGSFLGSSGASSPVGGSPVPRPASGGAVAAALSQFSGSSSPVTNFKATPAVTPPGPRPVRIGRR
ncbi:hypothetical protein CAOG_06568 [Capsaspora owczarzaki ATCC 30864]|uniref:hypothetical protein n=1 Tax=Capsaspora owczarzaki (strain ATCC 30864) TaxID=595528 RepID=UPI000352072C|nr:hypothetical protein CAOG_06568 [Capsaspora owczarzaki ATCC 30864]|eukprot:XP_004345317.2 hypothetical protein CAOG_06568 [Capsaspora owczarzaki ATCC 30864]